MGCRLSHEQISGMTSACNGSILPLLSKATRPPYFSCKHKAERSVSLVLTPLSDPTDESVADALKVVLDTSSIGHLPMASLFPTFLYLQDSERLERTLGRVLGLKLDSNEELAVPDTPPIQYL